MFDPNKSPAVEKFPLLKSIPLAGTLFRDSSLKCILGSENNDFF